MNVDPNLAALIAGALALATLIVNAVILIKLGHVGTAVDGVTSNLVEAKSGQARAEGKIEGAATEQARTNGSHSDT